MTLPTSVDVVIVGAGVQGASVAHHLRKLGDMSIAVLERGRPGESGSSPRSAAMLVHQTMEPTTTRLARESISEYSSLQHAGVDIGYHRTGGILFANTPDGARILEAQADLQAGLGLATDIWTPDEIAARSNNLIRTDDLLLGIFCHAEGYLDPRKLVGAYLAGLDSCLYSDTHVQSILVSDGSVVGVETQRGEHIRAKYVVNAAGVGAARLAFDVGVSLPIVASERSLLIMDKAGLMDLDHFLIEDFESEWYFRPHPDGILVGLGTTRDVAESELVDAPPFREELLQELHDYLSLRMPAAIGYRRANAWSGYRPLLSESLGARDELPVLGPVANLNGYINCCGVGAYGVTLAASTGSMVAAYLASSGDEESAAALTPYSSDRFAMEGS